MSFWDFINKIQSWAEKGVDNHAWIITGAVIIFVMFILGILFAFGIWKGEPPEHFSKSYIAITKQAPSYCATRGFNSWNFVGRDEFSNAENQVYENLTFECLNVKNESSNIEEFLKN